MPTEKNPFDKINTPTEENEVEEIETQEVLPDESVAMMEDGSAVVDLMGRPAIMPEEGMSGGHYDNLVPTIDDGQLQEIGADVYEKYQSDKESRQEWEETFQRGFDLLGLKLKETSEPFEGACTAVHPLLIESAVKFQSKASQELFPAGGPVMAQIIGTETEQKQQQASRVKQFMNYQLTDMMPEYFHEFERMLFHLPIIGSAFKKIYYDASLDRPCSEFVPIDQFYVSYHASDLMKADRYTHVILRNPNDLAKEIAAGVYEDIELPEAQPVEQTSMSMKVDEIMGTAIPADSDPQYVLLEQHCYLDLDDSGIGLPYIVTVEESSQKVLSIRRNYNEDDPTKQKKMFFTHYKFVPGFGFYGLGLIHFLGNLTMTATAAMRNLVDSGQFATLPAGFKAKGVKVVGDNEPLSPGEFRDVEATGVDLNRAIVPLPYKEPSSTLYQMLGFVAGAGQKFADSTEQVINDSTNYGPVGTTMALLEASSKFFSAIHKRLHYSQKEEFKILARINFESLPDSYPYEVPGASPTILKMDFDGKIDVIPVSDPNIPSSAHRLMLSQLALQLASQAPPGTYNIQALHRTILQAANMPNLEAILPPQVQPQALDPVSDIQAAVKGMPIAAFPGQDHMAHITVKSSYLTDPMNGGSPIMQKVQPVLEANIKEHMIMRYQEQINGMVSGVATDPATLQQVQAQAAQQISQANQAMGKMETPEQQMVELEKKRLEIESEKLGLEALQEAANLAVKQRELTLKEEDQGIKALKDGASIAVKRTEGEKNRQSKIAGQAIKTLGDLAKEEMKGED